MYVVLKSKNIFPVEETYEDMAIIYELRVHKYSLPMILLVHALGQLLSTWQKRQLLLGC